MKSISASIMVFSGVVLFSLADTAGYYEWYVRWVAMLIMAVGFVGWVHRMRDDS